MDRRAGGDVDRMNVGLCGDVEEGARLSRARKAARFHSADFAGDEGRSARRYPGLDSRPEEYVCEQARGGGWMEDEFERSGTAA